VKKGRIRNIISKVDDMTTMNDLLYNYQDTNEFVCSDGRMSVNGICPVEQPAANVDTSITEEIIETFHDGEGDVDKDWKERVKRDKILKDLEGTSDYFPKLGKEKSGIFADLKSIFKRKEKEKINQEVISPEINQKVISPSFVDQSIVPTSDIKHISPESITHNKIPTIDKTLDRVESIIEKTTPKLEKEKNQLESIIEKTTPKLESIIEKTTPKLEKFEWEFDKEKKIDTYKNTVNNNISEYNNFIDQKLGISPNIQNAARVGGTVAALAGGSGVLTAVVPWVVPFIAGGAIRKAEKERIQNITNQDKQGDIQTVDMMTYNNPPGIVEDTPGGGEFSHHSSPDPVSDAGGDAEWGGMKW